MSDAARWMIAFAFISLPSIAFGGYLTWSNSPAAEKVLIGN
jgi:hypothetical protein